MEKNNFSAVAAAAHQAGIRIVAIDIKDIYGTQNQNKISGNNALNRVMAGDYSFANIIQHDQDMRGGAKGSWVALIGAAHVEGLERLLHQPVITVIAGDRKESVTELNCRNKKVHMMLGSKKVELPKADVILTVPIGGDVPVLKASLSDSQSAKL